MKRITEPELMVDEAQVRAYAEADFSEPHDHFIALLREKIPDLPAAGLALDLGCGAGDISYRFAAAFPDWRVHGIDGSGVMLRFAADRTVAAGLDSRVTFAEVMLPARPSDTRYDLVFSNSLLHHLADPQVFWSALTAFAGTGGHVFVMDLLRPQTVDEARTFVRRYAVDEPEQLQADFFNSLLAAFEQEEVERQLAQAGLGQLSIERVSDRHCIAWGNTGAR